MQKLFKATTGGPLTSSSPSLYILFHYMYADGPFMFTLDPSGNLGGPPASNNLGL